MSGHRDLRRLVWGALACAVVALLLPWGAASLLFAAPLALLMPGYAITAAAFARQQLEWPRFAVLCLALSLAVLALGALPLNYLPGGVRDVSWALLLVLVVFGASLVAARRRGGQPAAVAWPRIQIRPLELGLLGGALVALTAALALASATLPADEALGFTELWIVPVPGTDRSEARIGVKSQEQEADDFDLRIRIGDERVVRRSFSLRPGEEREVRVDSPPRPAGTQVAVVATLLRHEAPFDVYRRVKGWLTAKGEGP